MKYFTPETVAPKLIDTITVSFTAPDGEVTSYDEPVMYWLAAQGAVGFTHGKGWYVANQAIFDLYAEHTSGLVLGPDDTPTPITGLPSTGRIIYFGVWAPDEATFWQSWIGAGICTAPGEFTSAYSGIEVTTSWSGVVTKRVNTEDVAVPGWHCNARVTGPLEAEFTYGLDQTDQDGNLLPIWDRTWAAQVFQLTAQASDPTTGFPEGMRNNAGVTYADITDFSSPSNVWA